MLEGKPSLPCIAAGIARCVRPTGHNGRQIDRRDIRTQFGNALGNVNMLKNQDISPFVCKAGKRKGAAGNSAVP